MKVLHVIDSVGEASGGTGEIIPRICYEQHKAGLGVTLACRALGNISKTAVEAQENGVRFRLFRGMACRFNRIGFSLEMMLGLGRLVRDCDVVHIHSGWMFPVWWAAHCARKYRKPYVMMPHGSLEPARLNFSKWKKRIVGWLFDRRIYREASMVWVTAESEVIGVRQYGVRCPIRVVPLGLDVQPYVESHRDLDLLKRLGVATDRKLLLYFSRITKFKGLDLLANAWMDLATEFPDWQLVIAGPDDYHGYRREIEPQFVAKCPACSFVFTGPVYGNDKYNMLKSVSAFILPTRNENFSIAVAEALASAVPVVCTKGAPWSSIDGVCGRWVDVSEGAIREGLREVLSASCEERNKLGLSGRALIEGSYSWSAIQRAMIRSYKEILK